MKKTRSIYLVMTALTIMLGILSRKIDFIPLFIGDVLYAIMVYFGFRAVWLHLQPFYRILLPLLFCFLIELQQLAQWPWLVFIRQTTLGHYVLGQGFLWSDLLCYTFGIVTALGCDLLVGNIAKK